MDVKLLEAFRAVVDSRSVTAAAQALGITQPAVSGQIAKLEESVGFPLFERAGGRLKPTPEGLLFYTEATRVLGEVDRLAATTAQIREGQSGRLVIASHPAAAISMLPPLVAAFVAERPGVSVRLVSRHSDVVSQLLPTEGYDLGIAELPVDETAVRLMRFQMRCVAILPPRHALASRKLLTPALLSGQPMIAPARSPQMLSRVYGTFAGADAQINAVVEAEFFASCCALVAAGTGWSLVDPLSAQSFSPLGIVARPFEPAVIYEIGVFHRRDREPSVLAAAFLELLESKLGSAR
jgi:DNA-binding transcriptional LysR family regulator